MTDARCKCAHDTGNGECELTRGPEPAREVVAHLRRNGRDFDCPRREPAQAERGRARA